MNVTEAQHEVRTVFLYGAVGQAVSGTLWLASAVAAALGHTRAAILVLVLGGTMIFPATQLLLRLLGRQAALRPENPLNALAMQVAFTVPLLLPLAGAAALHRLDWFYPAVLVIVGAHYLPFVFLYGMNAFYALAAAFIGAGFLLGFREPAAFATGGFIGAAALLAFATWAALAWRSERAAASVP